MLVAVTMDDWGVGLAGAKRVYWTGRSWSSDLNRAKRFTDLVALLQAIPYFKHLSWVEVSR